MMRRTSISLLLASLASGSAVGQTSVVVPAGFADAEAPNAALWSLAPFQARRQLLIDASALAAAQGRKLRALWLRRNASGRNSVGAGRLRISIWISHARRASGSASSTLADNRGAAPQLVFRDVVQLSAAAPPRSPAPWRTPFALQFAFSAPFVYTGGPLCIETLTEPVTRGRAEAWWPVDARVEDLGGLATPFGTSCIRGLTGQPAGAIGSSLVAGASARFFLRGRFRAEPVIFGLGVSDRYYSGLGLPFDLTPFGAPGCTIYNDVLVSWPAAMQRMPGGPHGRASAQIDVPAAPAFAGATVFTQWFAVDANNNALGLGLSNSVRAVFAARQPSLPFAWIEAEGAAAVRGMVIRGRAPVMRFDLD